MRLKSLILAIFSIAIGVYLPVSVFAFMPDNGLLSKLYDRIDTIYTQQPNRLLQMYKNLPMLQIKYARHEEVNYYLQKLTDYIHGKLFSFDQQPDFVCLPNRVQKGDTVEIDYTIKGSGNTLFLTTRDDVAMAYGRTTEQVSDQLAFNPGYGQVMRGMDQLTLGTQLGQRVGELLQPRDAYGNYKASLVMTFSGASRLVELTIVELGENVALPVVIGGDEKLLIGKLIEKSGDTYVVDFNHPLAGQEIQLILEPVHLFK